MKDQAEAVKALTITASINIDAVAPNYCEMLL